MKRMFAMLACLTVLLMMTAQCRIPVSAEREIPGLTIEVSEETLVEIEDEPVPLGLPDAMPQRHSPVMPSVAAGVGLVLALLFFRDQRRVQMLRGKLAELVRLEGGNA